MDMKSNRPKVYVRQDSVRGLQRSLGLSDGAMAEKIGVSRQTYLRGLSGEPVSPDFAAGLLVAFGGKFEAAFYVTTCQNANAIAS